MGFLDSAETLQAIFPFLFEEERCRLSLTTTKLLDRERLAESRAHWEILVSHLADQAAEEAYTADAAADAALWVTICLVPLTLVFRTPTESDLNHGTARFSSRTDSYH